MSRGDNEHGQRGPTASRPTFLMIQVLRGFAALTVVAHHSSILVADRLHLGYNWVNGASGVDLFFVISGFVMTISSRPLEGAAHPARTFLARRLERIVPMYWIVTLAKVMTLLLWPGAGSKGVGGWRHVVSSLLFLPSTNPRFMTEPILIVGWSLNFEMAFYLLFALALLWRRPPIRVAGPVLLIAAITAITGHFASLGWVLYYQGSIVLEFLGGMLLAMMLPSLQRIPWQVGLAMSAAGVPLLWFCFLRWVPVWRGLVWGLPAVAVVAGMILMEKRWGRRMPRWALKVGDASYSIYLVHTFVLPAIGLLLVDLRVSWAHEVITLMGFCTLVSAGAGVLVYRWIEQPINNWLKGRRRTAIPAVM